MLFRSTNLDVLTESLKSDPLRYRDKAVKSVRSQVVNLKEALNNGWNNHEFLMNLENSLRTLNTETISYKLNADDLSAIEKLRNEKYSNWVWNYGYGPTYTFKKRSQIGDFIFAVEMEVVKGIITEITPSTNYSNDEFIKIFRDLLIGMPHEKNSLLLKISNLPNKYTNLPEPKEMIKLLF